MEHPPYFPDLALNDLFLFPKIRSALKGQIFQDTEDIQKNMIVALKAIAQWELLKQWQHR
jgi:hypothetical protein